jgi:hypothetical protein
MNFVIYQNRERLYVLQVTRFTVIPSHEPVWFVCGDVPEVGCSQCQDRRQQVSEDASISYKFRCWLMDVGVVPITVDRVTVALRWWICCAAYASIVIHQKILSWTVGGCGSNGGCAEAVGGMCLAASDLRGSPPNWGSAIRGAVYNIELMCDTLRVCWTQTMCRTFLCFAALCQSWTSCVAILLLGSVTLLVYPRLNQIWVGMIQTRAAGLSSCM